MRQNYEKQMPIIESVSSDHPEAKELDAISAIIENNLSICDYILQDLNKGKLIKSNTGARGMTAEQVFRAAVVKHKYGFTYEDLAFHLSDSEALRKFCRIDKKGFKKSTLQKNIKAISEQTWQAILEAILGYAKDEGIEKGRKVRFDCTAVESNIHEPFDNVQLWDCVRVLTRLLNLAKVDFGIKINFTDHQRVARKTMNSIRNAKQAKKRNKDYEKLIKTTRKVLKYAKNAKEILESMSCPDIRIIGLIAEIEHYATLTEKVINQTERRVIHGEKVPASEKIVSIFEEHTDIIKKDNRDDYYGHKILLAGGASNLILDCKVLEGNPADVTLVEEALDRQNELYGRYPLKVALDGGFASKANLEIAKSKEGIKDVCFSKKRGMEEADMCRSNYVYKKLWRFRAGIESGISWLKRCFGLTRCTWKGFESFKCYVLSAVVAANLVTLARKKLATT